MVCSIVAGRSSHEERGLKYIFLQDHKHARGRSSHEERGLKSSGSGAIIKDMWESLLA